jgi:hypothetical protein
VSKAVRANSDGGNLYMSILLLYMSILPILVQTVSKAIMTLYYMELTLYYMILMETVSKAVRAQCDGGNFSSSAMSTTNECRRVRCLMMGAREQGHGGRDEWLDAGVPVAVGQGKGFRV